MYESEVPEKAKVSLMKKGERFGASLIDRTGRLSKLNLSGNLGSSLEHSDR